MRRPGIASVSGNKILLKGTTIEEIEEVHMGSLVDAVKVANESMRVLTEGRLERKRKRQLEEEEHKKKVDDVSKRLKFD